MTGIRLKSIVKIPANIVGEGGITVEQSGGTVTIGIDPDQIPSGFNWRGPWSNAVNYEIDDGVGYEGASYIAIAANLDSEPPSANWDVMAQAGSSPVVDDQITPAMLDADTAPKQLAFRDRLNFVSREGDTLTGHLVLPTGPAASNAVRKDYVDTAIVAAAPLTAVPMQFNGSMEIDQPNSGASIAITAGSSTTYLVDGWFCAKTGINALSIQQATSVFTGHAKELKATITTAQPAIGGDLIDLTHPIEGYRIARLSWGTAAAIPLTVGFWARSSVAGVAPVFAINSADTAVVTSSVTITTPNVAQFVTTTFAAQTTGTWLTDSSIGIKLSIRIASAGLNIAATNGNIFEITGLVVLPGTQVITASQALLIARPYDQELMACQRYYQKIWMALSGPKTSGVTVLLTSLIAPTMRVTPTIVQIFSAHAFVDGTITRSAADNVVTCSFMPTSTGGFIFNENISLDARL